MKNETQDIKKKRILTILKDNSPIKLSTSMIGRMIKSNHYDVEELLEDLEVDKKIIHTDTLRGRFWELNKSTTKHVYRDKKK
jgi:hypothetical protein